MSLALHSSYKGWNSSREDVALDDCRTNTLDKPILELSPIFIADLSPANAVVDTVVKVILI